MEWLANMPGPTFLGFFALVILVVLGASFVIIRSNPSRERGDPLVPVLPNAYEMAYMRGGEAELGKLALIELARKGYVRERGVVSAPGGKATLRQADQPPPAHDLSAPQRTIFELVGKKEQPVSSLVRHPDFAAAVEEIKSGFIPRLHEQGLIVGDLRRAKVLFLAAVIITGLGGYKLADSLLEDRFNIGFLIVFLLLGLLALWHVVGARLTWRGEKYFRKTQEAYRYDTTDAVLESGSREANDMLLHVGLFGAPILLGTAASGYATMIGLDPRRRYSDSGCSSDCGDAGSSSDGGGDGGCGGCGGD